MKEMYDVLVIGAGVVGCSTARELSKYDLDIAVLERREDVSCGTSKANSGMIHGGYDATYGTLKAKLSKRGNELFTILDNELHFGHTRCGSLVLAFDDEDIETLKKLQENGNKNGVETEIIGIDRIHEIEPNISNDVKAALYCKTAGIAMPFQYCVALAENAIDNGVDFFFNEEVVDIKKDGDVFTVKTNGNEYKSKYVVNAAGVYADKISRMICETNFNITPRKGEYMLLDKCESDKVHPVIFPTPKAHSKGIALTRSHDGNVLVGPNAEYIDDKEDVSTDSQTLDKVWEQTEKFLINKLDKSKVITQFAGLRAVTDSQDFIIEESSTKGFINAAAIQSPGFTVSYAIAEMLVDILKDAGLTLKENKDFNPNRRGYVDFEKMTKDEINELIKKDSRFARVICRCETITEGQIVDVLHRGIKVTTLDGVKRRMRAGMGRCQGGFCSPRVMEIIKREYGMNYEDVTKKGEESYILTGKLEKGGKN